MAPLSPLAVFTQQKVKTPPPSAPTPPPTPADGTSVDPPLSPLRRPSQPPPAPPTEPLPVKQKPQVPRKPQTKRVSFIQETPDEPERYPLLTNDTNTSMHELDDEQIGQIVDTNDACEGMSSLLIRNQTPTELELSRPVPKASRVLHADLIIPPPPLFDTYVSDSELVDDEDYEAIMPPITVIPDRIILPEPAVAETSMQSSNSTNSPETENPPSLKYNVFPISGPVVSVAPIRSVIISEVPSNQVFRIPELPAVENDGYYNNNYFSVSPIGEPNPPELLHAQYKTLPTVSHVPNSPCSLHPDQAHFDDHSMHSPLHRSLKDLRTDSISAGLVHSNTYPPINPYPSLTTVAGTYNPYTCTVPVFSNPPDQIMSHKSQTALVSTLGQDINANVTSGIPVTDNNTPKSVQSERRVRFGEVTTLAETDRLSDSSQPLKEGSPTPASNLKPAWSSKIKAFAIGEVKINRHLILAHTLSFF